MTQLSFEGIGLDLATGEVRVSKRAIHLPPLSFQLLAYLAQHATRVVSTEELRTRVWEGSHVGRSTIPTAVRELRRALADDAELPRFIETVRGRGYRFIAPPRARARGSLNESSIFGRDGELAELTRVAAEVRGAADRLRCVLLHGESGIGKTQLLEEFCSREGLDGSMALIGGCTEDRGAPALWPWIQILEQLDGARRGREVFRGFGPQGASDTEPQGAEQRFVAFARFGELLREASSERPLIVAVEDLHRADLTSLRLFEFLVRERTGGRILLVGTLRPLDDDSDPESERARVMESIETQSKTQKLPLGGLAAREIAKWLEAECIAFRDHLPEAILEITAGNPLLISQLLHTVEPDADGNREIDESRLQQGVPLIVEQRTRGLDASTRRALSVASVAGSIFDARVLGHAAGISTQQVREVLEAAQRSFLVEPRDEALGRYRFCHAEIRAAFYDALTSSLRADFHGRVARAIVALHGDHLDPVVAALAHHCALSDELKGDAIAYSLRAAEVDLAFLGWEDAIRHLERARDLQAEFAPGDRALRADILTRLGEARMWSGAPAEALTVLEEAIDLADALGDHRTYARAALAMRPDFFAVEVGGSDEAPSNMLERAIDLAPLHEVELRSQLLAWLAIRLRWRGETERLQHIGERLRHFDDAELSDRSRLHLDCAQHALLDHPDARRSLLERIISEASRLGVVDLALIHRAMATSDALEIGDIAEFERQRRLYETAARRSGRSQALWYIDMFAAAKHILDGRFPDAEQCARRVLREGIDHADVNAMGAFGVYLLVLSFETDEWRKTVDVFPRLLPRINNPLSYTTGHARMLSHVGDIEGARAHYELVARDEFSGIPNDRLRGISLANLAPAAHALGDAKGAELLYAMLEPYAPFHQVVGIGCASLGSYQSPLGLLAQAMGDLDRAISHFESAVTAELRCAARSWAALSLERHANALLERRRRGDALEARARVEQGLAMLEGLPLVQTRRRLAAVAKRCP